MKNTLIENLVGEFTNLILDGINSWVRAGEIIVDLIDTHGMDIEMIASRSDLDESLIGRFEALGRKSIAPHLLVAAYPAANHLLQAPYSEQLKLKDSPVDLLTFHEGETTVLKVMAGNLTTRQCKQVFAKGHVRSIEAQRAFIEDQRERDRRKDLVKRVNDTYKVKGRKVTIYQACEFTARQIAAILAEMER